MSKTELLLAKEELEFKAEVWHRIWMEEKAKDGWHIPTKHLNKFEVAPPLRGDGKTYCDLCSVNMVPYGALPERVKDYDRLIVTNQQRVEIEWANRKRR